ncbi:AKR_HP2_G0004110.mRNA.1.CDS.1 [Saccharomyces cerevisiae]|nr:AKR_HP2_G0004110.mRNA.1.CDS.1 [Saccharomyces cerevisiae]CAI6406746.1 AKR_HP2_G0004110.mRNA.1.CDS.1 [Saccharomyces cerevisiae]
MLLILRVGSEGVHAPLGKWLTQKTCSSLKLMREFKVEHTILKKSRIRSPPVGFPSNVVLPAENPTNFKPDTSVAWRSIVLPVNGVRLECW